MKPTLPRSGRGWQPITPIGKTRSESAPGASSNPTSASSPEFVAPASRRRFSALREIRKNRRRDAGATKILRVNITSRQESHPAAVRSDRGRGAEVSAQPPAKIPLARQIQYPSLRRWQSPLPPAQTRAALRDDKYC